MRWGKDDTGSARSERRAIGLADAKIRGSSKDQTDWLFASIQTQGKGQVISFTAFAPDHFDYIVVDELHHAAADTSGDY